ncbi:MAG: DNA polymerase III subunit alpha [Patescibacteria group bacterium]
MFIHLHNHSHYSLLDGLPKIKDYVNTCLEYKMPAMALTDHGALYGVIEFYQKAKDAGVKPIIGMEAYIAPRRLIYKKVKLDDKPSHLVLLAKNNEGYKNLIQLATIAQLDGFYYKPRLDKEVLKKYSKGLIATSACWVGEISKALRQDDIKLAEKLTDEYKNIFGKDNFYLESVYLGENIRGQDELHGKLIDLSKKTKTPLIMTKDSHYINLEDTDAQDALLCINTGTVLNNPKRLSMKKFDCSFTHPKLMEERFKDLPDAIENTQKIASLCNVNLDLGKWVFPAIEIPKGKTADDVLRENTEKSLEEKFPNNKEYEERINYELNIIKDKGYSSYFLVVADLINWARSQNIVVTTRGSAAGSLVSYLTGIIDIDPMYFKLPFERFLNPFRPSPPDIDMDFADNLREEVINYAIEKYGSDKVAQICTFGTMMARGSVRDVTRVLDFSYEMGDKLAKMIPMGSQGFPMTIKKALEINPDLKQEYDSDPNAKQVIDLAQKIEGCARHSSVHAAGTLISPTKITDYVPLQRDPSRRKKITQFDMHASEVAGLLKFDFLGITNLSIIGEAVKLIKNIKNIKIDLNNLPFDDQKTFDLLAKGQTIGLFQLSGGGMTKHLVNLKPTVITDIMAMVALYRPGPMESIPEFIRRKHNPETISYLDDRLKDILDMSYGIITYQDDVMLIAIRLAGYTWEEADKFRKAMGKKIPEQMIAQEGKFKEGCQKNGLSKEKTEQLWELIKPFASYGFNKAHGASYGLVAYKTAYLKANFPAEYMTSLMSVESGDEEKISAAVQECQKMGIKVLPPDINESRKDFTYINDNEIRFGLLTIKNLGHDIVVSIINERKENGPYKSLADLLNRVKSRNLNKKSLDALAKAGALDNFGERNLIVKNMDNILNYIKTIRKEKETNQASLFSVMNSDGKEDQILPLNLSPTSPINLSTKLAWEKELLGLYVSDHPFSEHAQKINQHIKPIKEIKETLADETKTLVGGVVTTIRSIFTKKNEPMMFVTIEDLTTSIEIVVFPRTLQTTKEIWQEGNVVITVGKISYRNDDANILADTAFVFKDEDFKEILVQANKKLITNDYYKKSNNYGNNGHNNNNNWNNTPKPVQPVQITQVWINLPRFFNSEIHNQIKKVLLTSEGGQKVFIAIKQNGSLRKIETNYKIRYNEDIKNKLEQITGKNSVITK